MSDDRDRLRLLEAGRKLLEQRKLNKPPPTSLPPSTSSIDHVTSNGPAAGLSSLPRQTGVQQPPHHAFSNGVHNSNGYGVSNGDGAANSAAEGEAMVRYKYKLQAQSARVDALLQEKGVLETQVRELQQKLAKVDDESRQYSDKEREHKRREEELQLLVDEERERIKEQNEAMTQFITKLQVQLVEEQTTNERLRRERERWRKLDEMVSGLEAQNAELRREKGELLGDKLELRERVNELEQKQSAMERELFELRERRDESEAQKESRARLLEEQLKEAKKEHEAEINALNLLLREQIENCKRLGTEKRGLELQREKDLEQIEQLMEERRDLMSHTDKKSEKLITEIEGLKQEIQVLREKLQHHEKDDAAGQAWLREREVLTKELDMVKTKFARTQRVERAKFLEFYKIINELREENETIKKTAAATAPIPSQATDEQMKRMIEENEKLTKRIKDQRDFIEELMKSKNKLMEQVSSEVKRNAALSKENAILHDTIRQQLSFIENSDRSRDATATVAAPPQQTLATSSSLNQRLASPSRTTLSASASQPSTTSKITPDLETSRAEQNDAGSSTPAQNSATQQLAADNHRVPSPHHSPAPSRQQQMPRDISRGEPPQVPSPVRSNETESKESFDRDNPIPSESLTGNHTSGQTRTRSGWFGYVPIVGRMYGEKELPKTNELVL